MKAARIVEAGQVEICEIPKPNVGTEEVLIKMKALGLCGSDLTTYRGLNPMVDYPRIPGHEIAGEIAGTGSNVPCDLTIGLAVTVSPYTACGRCKACRIGRINCCKYNQTMGVQRDGAATEYICVPYSKVFRANGFSNEQIACIEPLSVGWHAVCRGQVADKEQVLVFGSGVIGLGAIAAAAFKGAEIIAVDIADNKLEKAKALGARYTINSNKENLDDTVEHITSADGPDVVIEAVGQRRTFSKAVDLASFAGRVVYIGYAKKPVEYETKLFVSKELDIKGSRNAMDHEFEAVIKMIASGKVDVDTIITQRFQLEQTNEALKFWDKNTEQVTKILITL